MNCFVFTILGFNELWRGGGGMSSAWVDNNPAGMACKLRDLSAMQYI